MKERLGGEILKHRSETGLLCPYLTSSLVREPIRADDENGLKLTLIVNSTIDINKLVVYMDEWNTYNHIDRFE